MPLSAQLAFKVFHRFLFYEMSCLLVGLKILPLMKKTTIIIAAQIIVSGIPLPQALLMRLSLSMIYLSLLSQELRQAERQDFALYASAVRVLADKSTHWHPEAVWCDQLGQAVESILPRSRRLDQENPQSRQNRPLRHSRPQSHRMSHRVHQQRHPFGQSLAVGG